MSPIALCVKIAKIKTPLKILVNASDSHGDLAGYKSGAYTRDSRR